MLAGVSVGAAQSATAAPVAGCGAGFRLMTVQQAFGVIDWRPYDAEARAEAEAEIAALDENGDNYLCVKQYKPNRGQDKVYGAEDYVITALLENSAKGRR